MSAVGRPASHGHVRLLLLLDSAERAGLTPLDVRAIHAIAYLANVLSPVWDIAPMDGKVLKGTDGPFYPELQADLDTLVGRGLVEISGVSHIVDSAGRWRLRAAFKLNRGLAEPTCRAILGFADELKVSGLLAELCLALSGLPQDLLQKTPLQDATYADPLTTAGNVVDFDEWQRRNFSVSAARRFSSLVPDGITIGSAEQLHLYMRHLQGRLSS